MARDRSTRRCRSKKTVATPGRAAHLDRWAKMKTSIALLALTLSACTRTAPASFQSTYAQVAASTEARRDLPALSLIVALHGKTTSSAEFQEVREKCDLKLFSQKQDFRPINVLPKRHPHNSRRVGFESVFGGFGLVVIARHVVDVDNDLEGAIPRMDTIVVSTRLIVGDCDERYEFGVWRGELPTFYLPLTPQELAKRYPYPDSDVVDMTLVGTRAISKRRTVNYHVPLLGLGPPCTYIFSNEKLAILELWPPPGPVTIVRPQPPPLRVAPSQSSK
jgi:hypothetical protein